MMILKQLSNLLKRQQASNHAARLLSGDLSEPEEKRIHEWQQASESNHSELQATLDVCSDASMLVEDPDILAVLNDESLANKSDKWWFQPPMIGVAASIVLCCVVAVSLLLPEETLNNPATVTNYSTGVGEQRTINLIDGTRITLNTNSRITMRFSDRARQITLVTGEAFFDVATDLARPFTVEMGARSVTVLGTQFNVRRLYEGVAVAVLEGVVALHPKEERVAKDAPQLASDNLVKSIVVNASSQYRLAAGTAVSIEKAKTEALNVLPAEAVSQHSGWRKGELRFDQQPFYKVVKEINRYSRKKVLIEDSRIMDLHVNAVLHIDRLEDILVGLEASLPITVIRQPDSIVIVGRDD